jgi:hypothetical protein
MFDITLAQKRCQVTVYLHQVQGIAKLDQMIAQGALSWPNLAQHFIRLRIEAVNDTPDNAGIM